METPDGAKQLDLRVAGNNLGRAIAEIVFATVHGEMCGPHRQETAFRTFSEALQHYVEVVGR
jgi:hypothetical protein